MAYKLKSSGLPFKELGSSPAKTNSNLESDAARTKATMKKNKDDKESGEIDKEGERRSKGNAGAKPTMGDY